MIKRIFQSIIGFTLIEMLVVISLLGLISTIAVGFLFTSLMGSNKAEVTKEVRQNGAYALSVMETFIISSRFVECGPSENNIRVIDIRGNETSFFCIEGKIASQSASFESPYYLTSDKVKASSCTFSCLESPGKPLSVKISFILSQSGDLESLRANEKSSQVFETTVIARNLD